MSRKVQLLVTLSHGTELSLRLVRELTYFCNNEKIGPGAVVLVFLVKWSKV